MTKIPKILISLSCLLFLVASSASAAELSLSISSSTVQAGDEFLVSVFLDAEGESVNATEGQIFFPQDNLDLINVYETDSIVSLWLEPPHQDGESAVVWSGVTPGGFEGVLSPYYRGSKPGKLFSLLFKAEQSGNIVLSISNAKAFLNDGKGTAAAVRSLGANLAILPAVSLAEPSLPFPIPRDNVPPEEFMPQIARDPTVFEGKWFLVFAAQDKGSGIDHYEVLETRDKRQEVWITAASPYLLKDQALKSYISVRAVDKTGNTLTKSIPATNAPAWYENYAVLFIIVIGLLVLYFVRKFRKSKQ